VATASLDLWPGSPVGRIGRRVARPLTGLAGRPNLMARLNFGLRIFLYLSPPGFYKLQNFNVNSENGCICSLNFLQMCTLKIIIIIGYFQTCFKFGIHV
jgi:hypothetical protein